MKSRCATSQWRVLMQQNQRCKIPNTSCVMQLNQTTITPITLTRLHEAHTILQ